MIKHLITGLCLVALMGCEQRVDSPTITSVKPTPVEAPVKTQTVSSVRGNRSRNVIFELHCAGCHNPGAAYAATKQLALVRGENMAVIIQRTDLSTDYIKYVVRDGLLEMPPFRPTDINSEELDNLAKYIVASAQAYQTKGAKND